MTILNDYTASYLQFFLSFNSSTYFILFLYLTVCYTTGIHSKPLTVTKSMWSNKYLLFPVQPQVTTFIKRKKKNCISQKNSAKIYHSDLLTLYNQLGPLAESVPRWSIQSDTLYIMKTGSFTCFTNAHASTHTVYHGMQICIQLFHAVVSIAKTIWMLYFLF